MEIQNKSVQHRPSFFLGWIIPALAVILAIAIMKVAGITFDLTTENLTPFILMGVAAILATVPKMLLDSGRFNVTQISLSVLVIGLVLADVAYMYYDAMAGLLFFIVLVFGNRLNLKAKHEWQSMLTFFAVGYWMALHIAKSTDLPTTFELENGQLVTTLNLARETVGYLFFTYLMMFTILGLAVGVTARGILNEAGEEGWFGYIPTVQGFHRNALPLMIALYVWVLAYIGSLWHYDSVSLGNKLGVATIEGYTGYVGFWTATMTGIVALIVAGMYAERWFTRSMLIGSMWGLYLVSSWYEKGIWTSTQFEGNWAALIWLAFTFFIGVAIYYIGTHEKYGGWSNLEPHEGSGARKFWSANWSSTLIWSAFIIGLAIRVQWYVVPSMNAFGTGTWDMTGGSDPWYMKRVVDYILAQNAHLVVDADRYYPIGGINPRPPLFSWSMAIGAILLEPFLGGQAEDAVWWSMLALPAIYGALTILPIAVITRDQFGKGAGVISAWLIAFMPAHVTHSTWALADHDAFVMLFISLGFMYWMKAVRYAGSARLTRTTSPNFSTFITAFKDVVSNRRAAVAYATLAGVSFGIASLGWKGFVVGPSILFLAYALQVALNLFRRRDSTILSTLFIVMLSVNLLMALPFYAHPQMDLVLNATGLQPFLFVLGFTLALTFITTGFRDKPWLLVLGTLTVSGGLLFGLLYVLKQLDISNAWDVLLTGSGYFTKTKIFGTIAEANAPNRAQLFASFGPITFVLALVMGILLLVDGIRHRKQTHLVFGVWVFAASFMAWNAARFMFNAAPVMAVLGAAGVVSLWGNADWSGLKLKWQKFGIRTPADRIAGARKAVWKTPSFSAIMIVMILIFSQQATYGLDSAIPGSSTSERELDEDIYNIMPDIFRFEVLGFSLLDSSLYTGNWYLGSFGSSFNDNGWNLAYQWLAEQDTEVAYSERPAFVSWWDYGFQALNTGQHPSVSDNFQSGIPASGNMLLARNQDDLTAMFIWQLAEGDRTYMESKRGNLELSDGFVNQVDKYLNDEQLEEFVTLQTKFDEEMVDYITKRSFKVMKTNRDVVMAQGYAHDDGVFNLDQELFRIWKDGERLLCEDTSGTECSNGDWLDQSQANITFTNNIRSGQDTVKETTHYVIGEYWYTADLVEEYLSVSTNIHRLNSRLALTVQLLDAVFEAHPTATIHDLYNDIINMEGYYTVQDYDGGPGETIDRNHEIRYFAVDNRLYPRAGRYTADAQYNSGQPMGIFGAPTILSGQDIQAFMSETYETVRGEFKDEMTAAEYEEAVKKDFLNNQAGADIDLIALEDVRIDHQPAFFDTMVARTYVGYGASSLGLDTDSSNPQPSQHFGQSGSPGSILQQAVPLPGAMMNHFVLANWYSNDSTKSLADANTLVKILKYYPGGELSGQVVTEDDGVGIPNARVLVERDAFSGEGIEDDDADTYWIPIGSVDADEEGRYSFIAPAGRIRVSAFAGTYNPVFDQDNIRDGSYVSKIQDLLQESNENRTVNEITAILGQVSNMTWLGEAEMNITGDQANRVTDITESLDISVGSSGVSGTIKWTGHESFEGEAVEETTFILRNIWSMTDNYTVTTTSGTFTSEESRILQGTGEVEFMYNGTFESDGVAFVKEFVGTYTREITDKVMYFGNGTWNGKGTFKASWLENTTNMSQCEPIENSTEFAMPANQTICQLGEGSQEYLFDGEFVGKGMLTSDGITTFVQEYEDGVTFEGIGSFFGTGIFNGTGLFIGNGTFSGPMVEPGSFYKTGLLPGTYNMIAQMENGKEVLLPEPVVVGITPSYDLDMTIPASHFSDTLIDIENNPLANATIEFVDVVLGEDSLIEIITDENGSFAHGPITFGEYYYRVDVDGDGWYDLNQTLFVSDESENLTLGFNVPPTGDLTIQLVSPLDAETNEPLIDVNNRTLIFDDGLGFAKPIEATSDEDGMIYVELLAGEYTIIDNLDESMVLYEKITIEPNDELSEEFAYSISVVLNGSLRSYNGALNEYHQWYLETQDNPDLLIINTETVKDTPITMVSGDLEFSTTTSSDSGNFSIRVPSGHDYHFTIFSLTRAMAYGELLEVSGDEDIDLGTIYLEPTSTIEGFVYLYDNATFWDSTIPGWESENLFATDETGLTWNTTVSSEGRFFTQLPDGVYDFEFENELLNATSIEGVIVNTSTTLQNSFLEFYVYPEEIEVTLNVFMASNADVDSTNGTMISPSFILQPMGVGTQVNITEDDYDDVGELVVSLTPGSYQVVLNRTSAGDENATDYDLVAFSFFDLIDIGLNGPDDVIDLVFKETYRVNGTLSNSTGDGIENSFLMYNEEKDDYFNIASDENGTFAAYVPSGDWLFIVAPYSSGEITEVLRSPVTINDDAGLRSSLSLQTVQGVNVSFQLQEGLTLNNLSDQRVKAISQDGLGQITFEKTNESGYTTELLMPGQWSLELNYSTSTKHWTLNTSDAPFNTDDHDGEFNLDLGTLEADLEVQIGGKVYWQIRSDNQKGIQGMNVTILSSDELSVNETIETDEFGVWRLFVPIQDVYNVTVSKDGYSTVYYETTNDSIGYVVENASETHDIEVEAITVQVSGTIVDLVGEENVGATIMLYPTSTYDRDPIEIVGSMSGEVLEWDAEVQPGEWVVYVTSQNLDENGGGVAIGLLDATVSNGGSLDLEMRNGGYILLSTSWTDIQGDAHHVGSEDVGYDLITEEVEIEFDFGDGVEFIQTAPANGTIFFLAPAGSVSMDSEFITIQHDFELEMEYNGGAAGTVPTSGSQPLTLEYNRRINSDTTMTIVNTSVVGANYDVDDSQRMDAIPSETEYEQITFDIDLDYDGTEVNDLFTLTGSVIAAPDSTDWIVEFFNGTEYVDELQVQLGIGENASDTSVTQSSTVSVRITLPPQNTTWHLDEGHRILLNMRTQLAETSEISLNVFVPQVYGFDIVDETEVVGLSPSISRQMSFTIENLGNGDDTFTLEVVDNIPEGWSVTPMFTTVTISKDDSRQMSFTILAGDNFTDGTKELSVIVSSEGEAVTTQTVDVTVQAARIKLKVDQSLISKSADADVETVLSIPVENYGMLDASSVIVYLTTDEGEELQTTISVPAEEIVFADFTLNATTAGNHRYDVRVDVIGEDADYVDVQVEDFDFSVDFYAGSTGEGNSIWVTLVIFLLMCLVIYAGFKAVRSGRTSSRF